MHSLVESLCLFSTLETVADNLASLLPLLKKCSADQRLCSVAEQSPTCAKSWVQTQNGMIFSNPKTMTSPLGVPLWLFPHLSLKVSSRVPFFLPPPSECQRRQNKTNSQNRQSSSGQPNLFWSHQQLIEQTQSFIVNPDNNRSLPPCYGVHLWIGKAHLSFNGPLCHFQMPEQ